MRLLWPPMTFVCFVCPGRDFAVSRSRCSEVTIRCFHHNCDTRQHSSVASLMGKTRNISGYAAITNLTVMPLPNPSWRYCKSHRFSVAVLTVCSMTLHPRGSSLGHSYGKRPHSDIIHGQTHHYHRTCQWSHCSGKHTGHTLATQAKQSMRLTKCQMRPCFLRSSYVLRL